MCHTGDSAALIGAEKYKSPLLLRQIKVPGLIVAGTDSQISAGTAPHAGRWTSNTLCLRNIKKLSMR
jgi:hypothetical protein